MAEEAAKRDRKGDPLNMRVDPELKAALSRLAAAEKRSVTNYVTLVLEEHVRQAEPSKSTPRTPSRPPRPSSGRQR